MSQLEADLNQEKFFIPALGSNNLKVEIEKACSLIAPLWPLANFVAVNPFLGYTGKHFTEAACIHSRIQNADMVLPLFSYAEKYESGQISMADLRLAVRRAPQSIHKTFTEAGYSLSEVLLVQLLKSGIPSSSEPSLDAAPFSAYLDRRDSASWQRFIREEAAKWCGAYYDRGQSGWNFPWKHLPFFSAWKAAASHDKNPWHSGLKNFKTTVSSLEDDPFETIAHVLDKLEIPQEHIGMVLHKTLLILPGWAGHLQYLDRESSLRGEKGDELVQLLAVLLGYELALFETVAAQPDCLLGWKRSLLEEAVSDSPEMPLELGLRILWQLASEHAIERGFQGKINPPDSLISEVERPKVQAVFCIDVRSELFRRSLEKIDTGIETFGFAGFFGLPIDYAVPGLHAHEARCPALLSPPVKACDGLAQLDKTAFAHVQFKAIEAKESKKGSKRIREAAASCFSFVETLGIGYLPKLVGAAFSLKPKSRKPEKKGPGFLDNLTTAEKVEMAAGILKGIGLTRKFAPLVLLCGHGSHTRNNPYASGLDCGACGGHAGDANARLAANLFNENGTRNGLAEKGINIPEDTVFLAGLHNTTTDDVQLFDCANHESGVHTQVEELKKYLNEAGESAAIARLSSLFTTGGGDIAQLRKRSRDWSQVRPEWGLAGNAAFIVAPRSWTAESDLNGRAFLHGYVAEEDPEGRILESILAGPLVVGSWINLQYYASATDNKHFGSGNKAIHNVVGGIGVALGNESDLRVGLPWQSVHDGEKLVHEPSRLHAIIAANPDLLDAILDRLPHVKELVVNEWIHFIALGQNGELWSRRSPTGGWSSL